MGETNSPPPGFPGNSAEFAAAPPPMGYTVRSVARSVAAEAEPISSGDPALATTGAATFSQP